MRFVTSVAVVANILWFLFDVYDTWIGSFITDFETFFVCYVKAISLYAFLLS